MSLSLQGPFQDGIGQKIKVKILKNQLSIKQRCSHQFSVPRTRQQSCPVLHHNWNLTFRHGLHHKMNIRQLANRNWTRWEYLFQRKENLAKCVCCFQISGELLWKDVISRVGPVGKSYSSTDFPPSSPLFSQRGKNTSPLPIPTSPPEVLHPVSS